MAFIASANSWQVGSHEGVDVTLPEINRGGFQEVGKFNANPLPSTESAIEARNKICFTEYKSKIAVQIRQQ
ncbi:hypothetical protein [Ensifer aridi]|uniref:hypothetical protein n=1 Tax=Ensifer aridi TaxID=1708715 RepID=UPI0011118428|nr:hypothetical protein [Ensifer aridi]